MRAEHPAGSQRSVRDTLVRDLPFVSDRLRAGTIKWEGRALIATVLATSLDGGPFIAVWSVLYVVLLLTLGIMSIRKGHWVMFLVGIFLPLFWLIGALMPRRRG